ncbi:MAG: Protein translocase subunit SecY [Chlamydiae bacterium]|nr:Protein translocase subunit SecY [Chlamydiota bacterium]
MIRALKRIYSTPDLKRKLTFTLLMLLIVRVGAFVPVPGINGEAALNYFKFVTKGGQNLLQLLDLFSGGAFGQMTVVALSIMPYITASIVIQLLVALVPSFQREIKENQEAGKRKIGNWTRVFATCLSVFQSLLLARYALQMNQAHPGIVVHELFKIQAFGVPWLFYLIVVFTMTTGTLFLIWVGEQITERGMGNGISLIIALGIVSQIPSAIGLLIKQLNLGSQTPGQMTLSSIIILSIVFVAVIMGTILVIQGQKNVPLQYARRIAGTSSESSKGSNAHLPLKINYAGVIPVIFASSVLMFPATIAQLVGSTTGVQWLTQLSQTLAPGTPVYTVVFVLLILFFTYFWTATQFKPDQIASDMKKNGAFIPGVRQGKPTEQYLESTMNRITLIGAVSLAFIAVLPNIISKILKVDMSISHFFGGTSLLILVGVILDTMQQVDSHLLMKKYDGLMKRGLSRQR